MIASECDVVIIGAGAAGLAAANELARARRSAMVIEARDRTGGRIWSREEPGLALAVELGAEFIHGRAEATFAALEKAGAAALDAGGDHWSLRDGKLEPSQDVFSEIQRAMRGSPLLKRQDMSFEAYIDRHLTTAVSSEACAYARMLAQGFDAADTNRASARAIVEEWTGGGSVNAPQFRPLNGYGALLKHLASELRGSAVELQLNTVVRSVRWSRHAVTVAGMFLGRPFKTSAKRAIVTLPLGVLQRPARDAEAVRFTPALTSKRDALKQLAPGPVLKVLLRFRKAFWEELDGGRYRDVAFFHPREAAFPTFWTALPIRVPLLVAWAAGPRAERLRGSDQAQIVERALESLAALFGARAQFEPLLEAAWVHDWQKDPYARGAYSYVAVGGDDAREALAKPLRDTLFFAGEAADTEGEAGTVAGALQTGKRAAREVLRSFRR
jgi:monoamine oxidase